MLRRTLIDYGCAMRFAPMLLLAIAMIAGCASSGGNAARAVANPPPMPSIGNDEVRDALLTSCGDCHTDQPVSGWQAKISPSYTFGHTDALVALNFSKWEGYSEKARQTDKALIAKVIEDNSMPPWDYKVLHPAAKMSPGQKQALLQWASSGAQPAH
jgi:hypothetical protein